MPARIFPYLIGLLQGYRVTATGLQFQFGFSHDRLTRTLRRSFDWQRLLLLSLQRLFGLLKEGSLVLDDTVIAKPYALKLEGASFVYSSNLERTVYGYAVVLLCWTNGKITLPLSWRWYRRGGKSRVELAGELLEEAKDLWGIQPQAVLSSTPGTRRKPCLRELTLTAGTSSVRSRRTGSSTVPPSPKT